MSMGMNEQPRAGFVEAGRSLMRIREIAQHSKRDKTAAAIILLESGWTYEQVEDVLSKTATHQPSKYDVMRYYPPRLQTHELD